MTLQHPADRGGHRRGPFERFAENASNFTSSPLFYITCVALVLAFVVVHIAGLGMEWQHLVGDSMAAVTLLLLALLKNSERRAERALQLKLDAIAAALLEQSEGKQEQAHRDLREAIRVEDQF